MTYNGNWSDWSVSFTETSSPSEMKSNSSTNGEAPKPTALQNFKLDFLDVSLSIYLEITARLSRSWSSARSLLRRKVSSLTGWSPKSDTDLFPLWCDGDRSPVRVLAPSRQYWNLKEQQFLRVLTASLQDSKTPASIEASSIASSESPDSGLSPKLSTYSLICKRRSTRLMRRSRRSFNPPSGKQNI